MNMHKELTGVELFDARQGGVYAGRCWLLYGPSGTGKSAIALHFLAHGIRAGQRCLLLSLQPAADVAIWAAAYGPDVVGAIERGDFIILEYTHYVPRHERDGNLMLPPEGFLELQDIIVSHGIRRVALDTALPWVITPKLDLLAEHVFSFVRAFERIRCTTLLTLPRPVSAPAVRLKNALEDVVPVSVSLGFQEPSRQRVWTTSKFLGGTFADVPVPYRIVPGQGAVEGLEGEPSAAATAAGKAAAPASGPPTATAPGQGGARGRVRFSSAIMERSDTAHRAPHRFSRFWVDMQP